MISYSKFKRYYLLDHSFNVQLMFKMPLISFFFLNIDLSEQWMLQTGFYTHSLQGENQEE